MSQSPSGPERPGNIDRSQPLHSPPLWIISLTPMRTENPIMICKEAVGNLAGCYVYNFPDFKVGTLDTLVELSDTLVQQTQFAEGFMKKLTQLAVELYDGDVRAANERLLKLDIGNTLVSCTTYVKKFNWDSSKYPHRTDLSSIASNIVKVFHTFSSELEQRVKSNRELKNMIQDLQKKYSGSLHTKSLETIVKKEHFVLNSEHLVTVLVVVPKTLYNSWYSKYERVTEMVVPRSSSLIIEEGENGLFNVTLFRSHVPEFKTECSSHGFYVREFIYDEREIEESNLQILRATFEKNRQMQKYTRWIDITFTNSYIAYTHLMTIKMFVESILRYGLPMNFKAVILEPLKSNERKIHETLERNFPHMQTGMTDRAFMKELKEINNTSIKSLLANESEFYPYVFFYLKTSFVDSK